VGVRNLMSPAGLRAVSDISSGHFPVLPSVTLLIKACPIFLTRRSAGILETSLVNVGQTVTEQSRIVLYHKQTDLYQTRGSN
jgi:hypothetical protein